MTHEEIISFIRKNDILLVIEKLNQHFSNIELNDLFKEALTLKEDEDVWNLVSIFNESYYIDYKERLKISFNLLNQDNLIRILELKTTTNFDDFKKEIYNSLDKNELIDFLLEKYFLTDNPMEKMFDIFDNIESYIESNEPDKLADDLFKINFKFDKFLKQPICTNMITFNKTFKKHLK